MGFNAGMAGNPTGLTREGAKNSNSCPRKGICF